jgi:phosphate starvation-inducible PhoH-like protein
MKKEVKLTAGVETLFGTLDENLRLLESALHLTAHLKNGSLEIEGEESDVERMERIVDDYAVLLKEGVSFSNGDLLGYLKIVAGDPTASLRALVTSGKHRQFGKKAIVPKSLNQRVYLESIDLHDMVFGIGPAGTGKTYLAVAMAISYLLSRKVNRIVLARPAVEAGERLGFLPGTLQEKVDPYLRPLYDALYDLLEAERVDRYLERGTIEIAPIAFMRGRTLNDSFIILDEAQNTTGEQMKMFLTRMGFNSKMVITGDITQIDLPEGRRSGLLTAMDVVGEVRGIRFVYFDEKDVVRHHLVQRIIRAYEQYSLFGNGTTRPVAAPPGGEDASGG